MPDGRGHFDPILSAPVSRLPPLSERRLRRGTSVVQTHGNRRQSLQRSRGNLSGCGNSGYTITTSPTVSGSGTMLLIIYYTEDKYFPIARKVNLTVYYYNFTVAKATLHRLFKLVVFPFSSAPSTVTEEPFNSEHWEVS